MALESRRWIRQVAAPCNVARGEFCYARQYSCCRVSAAVTVTARECVCGLWTGDATAASAAVNQQRTQPTIVDVIVFDSFWRNIPRPPSSLSATPRAPPPCTADYSCGPSRRDDLRASPLYFPNDLITDFVSSSYFLFSIPSRVDPHLTSTQSPLPTPGWFFCKVGTTTFLELRRCEDRRHIAMYVQC